jgi:hypothetical protein
MTIVNAHTKQEAFERAVQKLRRTRAEVTDIEAMCLKPDMRPIWIATGIDHPSWGQERIFFLGIGDVVATFDLSEQKGIEHVLMLAQAFVDTHTDQPQKQKEVEP